MSERRIGPFCVLEWLGWGGSELDERAETRELLARWHDGERAALDELLRRHLPWIEEQVSRRLGSALRAKAETQDFVQDAVIEALRYAPRFSVANEAVFRRILLRIIRNVLCDRHDWFTARRREMSRERPLARDTVLDLDPPRERVPPPGGAAEQAELEARVRLALEFLSEEERRVVILRDWDGLEFGAIGDAAGVSADAARMRYHRALVRLTAHAERILSGELRPLLDGEEGIGHGDD